MHHRNQTRATTFVCSPYNLRPRHFSATPLGSKTHQVPPRSSTPRPVRPVMRSTNPSNRDESVRDNNPTPKPRPRPISLNNRPPQLSAGTAGTVIFMAVADEFDMPALSRRLFHCKTEYGGIHITPHGPVLRLNKLTSENTACAEAFVFPYGCVVVWGTYIDRDDFMSLIVEDALEPCAKPVIDTMDYVYGVYGSVKRDVITLEAGTYHDPQSIPPKSINRDRLEPSLERLAISWGLAQSIKLGAFESATRATIENTRHLPEELAHSGHITASRREISRLMGRLFLDRYRYHLSGDLLMTPVFFWEHEQYLPSYRRVERYLEVRERGDVLDKRVTVLQELYHLLGEELRHQNSMALELAITVMIAFEILLTLLTLAKESVRSVFSACALFFCLIALGWTLWRLYRRRRVSQSVSRFPRAQNGVHR